MVVRFTTTYVISAYHHKSCEFESRSWQGVLDTTLCDKVYRHATGRWSSPVSITNKTYRHDITEILLKATIKTTTLLPITLLLVMFPLSSCISDILFVQIKR